MRFRVGDLIRNRRSVPDSHLAPWKVVRVNPDGTLVVERPYATHREAFRRTTINRPEFYVKVGRADEPTD